MFRLFSFVLLSLVSFGFSTQTTNYIRFVNAVDGRNITVTTNVQGVPAYDLPFTGLTDYIPISTNGGTSVDFSINGTSLTATPLSLPMYTSMYTLVVVLLDHNNVLNLIPYNETLPQSMIENDSTDGTMPARSWVRLIGLNHVEPTYLISLNNTDNNTVLFNHVAYLEATPYVEIPSHTQGLLAFVSSDTSMNWTIVPNFANSTAYTVLYFSVGATISTDRYVPYTVLTSSSSSGALSGSSTGTSDDSGSTGSSSTDVGASSSTSAIASVPVTVSNVDSSTSSSSRVVAGLVSVAFALLAL